MPQITNLAESSPEDVKARIAELKGEFINLAEGRRSDDASGDRALAAMLDEVAGLDGFLSTSELEIRRSQLNVEATASAIVGNGVRSIGDLLVTDDFMKYAGGRYGEDGKEFSLAGDEGRDATRFLRSSGIRATVSEWAAGGPPTDAGQGASFLNPVAQPVAPLPRHARLFLRDLMGNITTQVPQIPYVRELNPTSSELASGGGATEVAEAALKGSATIAFQSAVAAVTVIATTLRISKQLFEDSPAVVQYINNRLPYLVKFREDAELLNGNGVWPNIPGITTISGLQSQGATAGQTAQTIGNAIAKVEMVDGQASAVVMNPVDAWNMFTLRAAAGAGTFDAGTPFSALPLTVWGIPSYRSRAYAAGKALVGDFALGGMIVDREQVNVQVYRERYAETNEILLVCEERIAPMWLRPDAFVNATIA